MADDPPSPHGLAALAISMSFVQALLKQGLIDRATVEATLKEAGLYAQALCIDCSPEVERETLRIVKLIKPEEPVAVGDASIAAATAPDAADPHKNGV
jgi:hypothetical protein